MNGISALIKGVPESSLALFPPHEDSMRSQPSATWKRFSAEPNQTSTLTASLQSHKKYISVVYKLPGV